MKKFTVTSFALFFLSSIILVGLTGLNNPENNKATSEGGEVTFTVRTVTENGSYAPKHVLAIWVEDANGFVKTRQAMANQRIQYLYTWKAASDYNVVDAITGATLSSHQTHTVTWDCTDLDGEIVPDGDCTIWAEFTEKHSQGPLFNLTFTKGPNAQTLTPPDETYFKDISLEFIPGQVGIGEEVALHEFTIYPNPGQGIFYLKSLKMQNTSLKVYDNSGRLILSQKMNNNSNGLIHQIDLRNQANGIYFVEIHDGNNKSINRIIKN